MLPATPATIQDLARLTAEQWNAVLAAEPRQAMAWMRAAARIHAIACLLYTSDAADE